LAVIARIQGCDPEANESWPGLDLVAHARACDDSEVAALAVVTDSQRGGSLVLLESVAAQTLAPILRDDLILHLDQLYDARLHGADAVILPAAELAPTAIAELAQAASSMHMAVVVEVRAPPDLERALSLARALVGIDADWPTTLALAAAVPPGRTVIALRDPGSIERGRQLRGLADAVTFGPGLADRHGIPGVLATLSG
jgi:indole-3-glycerol phosphate synthase